MHNSKIIIYNNNSYFSYDGINYTIDFINKPIDAKLDILSVQIDSKGQVKKQKKQATIIEQIKMDKIHSCKYSRRNHSHGKRWGHRPRKTIVEVK